MTDLTGRTISSSSLPGRFTTGSVADFDLPSVLAESPPDGTFDVPVNALVVVQMNEPVSAVSPGTVSLTAGGAPLVGPLVVGTDRRTLTFTPAALLDVNTLYSHAVDGFVDLAGNAMAPFASTFTTAASATLDTTRPRVISVSPVNGASSVAVDTTIVFTFDEVVDPTSVTVASVVLTIDGVSGTVAGSYAISGEVVTFTPASPLPSGARLRPRVVFNTFVRDLAGNNSNGFSSFFDTAP